MLAARHRARLTMQDRNVDVQEGLRVRNVSRRLFQEEEDRRDLNAGVEDNYANCLFEEARKHREEAKKRWNFDFEKEVPLPGNYEWVKLDPDGNEIPMTAEEVNKTEKRDLMEKEKEEKDLEELEELGDDGEEEKKKKKKKKEKEDSPEEKEADADDKAEPRRQKVRTDVS